MNEPTPSTDTPAPIIRHISIHICQQCLEGKGSECHTPGCALCFHRVDIPIMRELYEILPEPQAPSLTGEEVIDTPETDAVTETIQGTGWPSYGRMVAFAKTLERRLSTARAQDKAALAERDATITQLRGDYQAAEAAVNNVLRLLPNRKTDSWEDAVNGWLKETAALRSEVTRLKTELEVTTQTLKNRVDTLAIADASVARLKAEVEEASREKARWQADRKQGREEALAILFRQSAEDFDEDFMSSHSLGNTGDYTVGWNVDKLKALFGVESESSLIENLDGDYWQAISERDDLRTRLAQEQEWRKQDGEVAKTGAAARDLAEQRFKEANDRLFRAGDEPLAILGVAEQRLAFTARELSQVQDSRSAIILERDRAEQRVRELEAMFQTSHDYSHTIYVASQCPAGTDLAAWVGQLAEDKRRLDTIESECWTLKCQDLPTGQGDADVGWIVISHHMAEPFEREVGIGGDSVRSAIDTSNPKTE